MSFLRKIGNSLKKRDQCKKKTEAHSPKVDAITDIYKTTIENVTTVGVRSAATTPGRNVAKVLPGLLLGSKEFAQDLQSLERYKVTHVLNMTEELENAFPDRFLYKNIRIQDRPSTQIDRYFAECIAFIDQARSGGKGCVLVHCYFGASRSASIVIVSKK